MQSRVMQFDFMSKARVAGGISVLLVVLSLVSLAVKQLSLGLDFTGGTLLEIKTAEPIALDQVRAKLAAAGFEEALVQHFGSATDLLIRVPPDELIDQRALDHKNSGDNNSGDNKSSLDNKEELGQRVFAEIKTLGDDITLQRIEFVGPQVGAELRDQSGLAMLIALGCMLLYITFRFQFKFALGAVLALFHDVIITLGLFSVAGFQFDLTVLAALLAVIGYSLNDTIVVSDRIRENFLNLRGYSSVEIINLSLNQTLSRTLVTSLTTLLVLLALLFFGGKSIAGFAIALTFGVLVGTYSSIYVASNTLMLLNIQKEDFFQVEVAELDDRP